MFVYYTEWGNHKWVTICKSHNPTKINKTQLQSWVAFNYATPWSNKSYAWQKHV